MIQTLFLKCRLLQSIQIVFLFFNVYSSHFIQIPFVVSGCYIAWNQIYYFTILLFELKYPLQSFIPWFRFYIFCILLSEKTEQAKLGVTYSLFNLPWIINKLLIRKIISGGGPNNPKNPYSCVCLHGDRKPPERKANLEKFKQQRVKFLICTDVAARGIDITGLPFSKYLKIKLGLFFSISMCYV